MLYPGNPELSAEAQERVTTAFRQVVAKLQEGRREEANIGLEFVLRLDPSFTPAVNLRDQLVSGAQEIDLSDIIGQMQAPTTDAIDAMLVEAVECYNRRDFVEASKTVGQVLLELPGHQEARQLQRQIQDALKVETQVGQFLAQAREALHRGDPQEAANFVMMAQALDPHHGGIAPTLQEIYASGAVAPQPAPAPDSSPAPQQSPFSSTPDDDFGISFDELDAEVRVDEGPAVAAAPQNEFVPAAGGDEGTPPWQTMSVQEVAGPSPAPPTPSRQAPAAGDVPPARDDVSDLFEVEQGSGAAAQDRQDGPPGLDQDELQELLERGERLFAAEDFKGAIDAWSRIYLLETEGRGVAERIEDAVQRLEKTEHRVESLLAEAQDAAVGGDTARALELINDVLAAQPDNVRARELSERLAGQASAAQPQPEAAAEMPELDDELFDDTQPRDEEPEAEDEVRPPLLDIDLPAPRKVLGLPLRTAAVVGAVSVMLVIAVVLVLVLRGRSSQPTGGDVYALRDQTEELFKQGRAREALAMVQTFQTDDPTSKQVLDRLAKRYEKALATPTPTPIPKALVSAQDLLARGLLFHAYADVTDGLRKHPGDPVLEELKTRIEGVVPRIESLQGALAAGNFQTAASIALDLRHAYPNRPDLREILERSLFNAALAEMRAYNLAGAEGYLRQYEDLQPGDETVARIMEFINKYKARPVDMTLKVFIGSLDTRNRRSLVADAAAPPAATPTPASSTVAAAGTPAAADG